MQAILTKYLGHTNTQGTRIKAQCDAGSITVPRDLDLDLDKDCKRVAGLLCDKLNNEYYTNYPEAKDKEQFPPWNKWTLTGGSLPNGEYCFVFPN